jgi:hypothetical protein
MNDDATASDMRKEELAAQAADRIKSGQHFVDWMMVGDGLQVGRNYAMRKAGTNVPKGRGYITAFGVWMDTRPWARELDNPTRNDLFWCVEHRSEIEAWRETLEQNERARINHPTVMKRRYEAAQRDKAADETKTADVKKKKEGPDDSALRQEMSQLRGSLTQAREEHRKAERDLNEARNNPLAVWQTNAEDAAIKLFHDNRLRAEAILHALAALFHMLVIPASSAATGQAAKPKRTATKRPATKRPATKRPATKRKPKEKAQHDRLRPRPSPLLDRPSPRPESSDPGPGRRYRHMRWQALCRPQ